jgi:hypothetical protein
MISKRKTQLKYNGIKSLKIKLQYNADTLTNKKRNKNYRFQLNKLKRVTKIENIKTDSTKILRPTHFSGPKDIKTNKFFLVLFPG